MLIRSVLKTPSTENSNAFNFAVSQSVLKKCYGMIPVTMDDEVISGIPWLDENLQVF